MLWFTDLVLLQKRQQGQLRGFQEGATDVSQLCIPSEASDYMATVALAGVAKAGCGLDIHRAQ